jgi:hypothetical protein
VTEDVQLAALAVIELVARQIVQQDRVQQHRDELEIILARVDARWVALEIGLILCGVVAAYGVPIDQVIEAKRAQLLLNQ